MADEEDLVLHQNQNQGQNQAPNQNPHSPLCLMPL